MRQHITPPRDKQQRKRNLISQAMALQIEITATKAQMRTTSSTTERHLLRQRIRGMQRSWLAKVNALAKEYND